MTPADTTPPQEATKQPLVSNEQIYEWANSASNGNYQRSSIRRSLFKMRDSYEAELATLRAELAEVRKPMRVIVQPDFIIDLGDE